MTSAGIYDPAMPDAPPGWMSRADAAKELELSTQAVDFYATAGRLRRWKHPETGRVWIKADGVRKLKAAREVAPE
jgi:hypothetical protein